MIDDPNDITNNVFFPKNDPWDKIDAAIGYIRDALAAVGFFCVVIGLALWWTGKL